MARVSKVRRSPQAVACGKRNVGELGKPRTVPDVGTARNGYTAIEAHKGQPGYGTALESKPRGDAKEGIQLLRHRWGNPDTEL